MSLNDIDTQSNPVFKPLSLSDIVHKPGKLMFLRQICTGDFPVYKVTNLTDDKVYALKCFDNSSPQASTSFKNEIRFSYLQHPNIVKLDHFEAGKELTISGKTTKTNYFLMDYCPFGNFSDLLYEKDIFLSEEIVRTYFHQLISALEYLHSKGVAHMDIKLENILLGSEYELKLCDFDSASYTNELDYGLGTISYRAPEIREEKCIDFLAADIYSAGMVLFLLKTGGVSPYLEGETLDDGTDLFELLHQDQEAFWNVHKEICGVNDAFFDKDFRELFMMMVQRDPKRRAKISYVKNSKWFKKNVLSKKELEREMKMAKTRDQVLCNF
jgi:serine/threonine protein kinase